VRSHSAAGCERAVAILNEAVSSHVTPGAVVAAGWGAQMELLEAFGWAQTVGQERPMSRRTLFDLASLTKVVATLPVVLRLVADGILLSQSRVIDVLPEFCGGCPGSEEVTIEHLLTHTSGLPAERKYWKLGLGPEELRRRFIAEPLEAPPGTRTQYSDIGFMVLGWVAEVVTGLTLDQMARQWVTAPLGMAATGYGPRPEPDVAATEPGLDGRPRVGRVHDENASALGSPAGHAGLFSSAADLGSYLGAWTGRDDAWLPFEMRQDAARDRTAGLGGHRGLGWAARHDVHDHLGGLWPRTAACHSGFTGTFMAFDLPSARWVVLLTNDVHWGRERGVVNSLREAVCSAVAP